LSVAPLLRSRSNPQDPMNKHRYSEAERAAVYRAISERRDMRHFLPDPIASNVLRRLLEAAHHAPSVGFMQPWRFIRITSGELRGQIHALVEQERVRTAQALHEREDEFMKLKVEGILDCAVVLVAALCDRREKAVFGRRTLPEMDLASLACAIQNIWLAARAEGLGMGWVSLFEPEKLKRLLAMPEGSHPAAILCLGHVERFYEKPMLEQERWAERMPLDDLLFENRWDSRAAGV
jgi:5,6-dimethylbenzimidazole synthase